jgi:alanine racemase
VAGTVCMDMFMVDLGAPDGPGGAVAAGDEAVLFGAGGPGAMEVARWAETIPYEIVCGVAGRVPRRYTGA